MKDKDRTINWLNDAIRFFQESQKQAATRWIAEQHQEREKACKAALALVEAQPLTMKSEPHPGNEDGQYQPGSCAHCGQFHSSAACPSQPVT